MATNAPVIFLCPPPPAQSEPNPNGTLYVLIYFGNYLFIQFYLINDKWSIYNLA